MSTLQPKILSIDSKSFSSIQVLSQLIPPSSNNQKAIIVCGSFNNSHQTLLNLAYQAPHTSESNLLTKLDAIIQAHKENLYIQEKTNQGAYNSAITEIDTIYQHIRALLIGIFYIKEISKKTQHLLEYYMSHLAAIIIQAFIIQTTNTNALIIEDYATVPTEYTFCIVPVVSSKHTIEYISAKIAVQYQAESINVYTQQHGIMSANPKLVPHAIPLECIDYTTALEVAYLGGKVLHPTSIHLLMQHNIPIHIYTLSNTTTPATTITTKQDTDAPVFCVTTQDKFSILTIRSTNMFDVYGYLADVFNIFKSHKAPIETVSTSEISITLAFASKYFSEALLQNLSKIGEIEYIENQSIVSIVKNKQFWKSPLHIAPLFTLFEENQIINMISLAQTGNNLSLVLDSQFVPAILPEIHNTLTLISK